MITAITATAIIANELISGHQIDGLTAWDRWIAGAAASMKS